MALEDDLKANTAAILKHTDALERFLVAAGTKTASVQSTDKDPAATTRAPRRTKAEMEADKAAEKEPEAKPSSKAKVEEAPAEDGIRSLVKDFLNYGDEGNQEDEEELDRRTAFIKAMNKHFGVAQAREIPIKALSKVRRWLKVVESGEDVDFDND